MWSAKVLLIEDDPGHARLIEKNLRRAGFLHEIIMLENGQRVLEHLQVIKQEAGSLSSLLMILDLNLPVMNGYQVLERVKADEALKKIPVIVLSTTDAPCEIEKCYALGCNFFITKPVQYNEFCAAIHNLGQLLSIIELP